jgi:hypothetical protein
MITARQQLGKQLFAPARDNNRESIVKQRRGKQTSSTIQTVFSVGSVQRGYKRSEFREAGSNTSTVTLRVVGGDEKGSLKSEAVKYGQKSKGTRTQERLR